MSKIYEALKQAEQDRAPEKRNALTEISERLAIEVDGLSDAMEQCREQLAALSGQIASGSQDTGERLAALGERLSATDAETGSAHQRLDRTAESFATAVATLHGRLDQVGQRIDTALQTTQQEIRHLESNVDAVLGEWSKRVDQLAHEVHSMLEGVLPQVDGLRSSFKAFEAQMGEASATRRQEHDEIAEPMQRLSQSVVDLQGQSQTQVRELASLRKEIDALTAEKAALRDALEAQALQMGEVMQRHRASLVASFEAQIENLRKELQSTPGRSAEEQRARTQQPAAEPVSTERSPVARSALKFRPSPSARTEPPARSALAPAKITLTARPSAGRWRWRFLATAALSLSVLVVLLVGSRFTSTAKSTSRSYSAAQAIAGLQDPALAERFTAGVNALQRGDFSAAEKAFREVVTLRPACVEARNNLAVALEEQNHREAAIEQLREAVRIQPDYGRARANLKRLNGEG